ISTGTSTRLSTTAKWPQLFTRSSDVRLHSTASAWRPSVTTALSSTCQITSLATPMESAGQQVRSCWSLSVSNPFYRQYAQSLVDLIGLFGTHMAPLGG
ncbi:hypothetical protein BC831DRAFT_494057, partial [Entophlyctis helioformis]